MTKVDHEQLAGLDARFRAGETLVAMAAEFGMTPHNLGRRMAKWRRVRGAPPVPRRRTRTLGTSLPDLVTRLDGGEPVALVAAECGLDVGEVERRVARFRRWRGWRSERTYLIPDSARPELLAQVERGDTNATLAETWDCSVTTIIETLSRWHGDEPLKRPPVRPRGPHGSNPYRPPLNIPPSCVADLRRAGWTAPQVAAKLGCSVKTVQRSPGWRDPDRYAG